MTPPHPKLLKSASYILHTGLPPDAPSCSHASNLTSTAVRCIHQLYAATKSLEGPVILRVHPRRTQPGHTCVDYSHANCVRERVPEREASVIFATLINSVTVTDQFNAPVNVRGVVVMWTGGRLMCVGVLICMLPNSLQLIVCTLCHRCSRSQPPGWRCRCEENVQWQSPAPDDARQGAPLDTRSVIAPLRMCRVGMQRARVVPWRASRPKPNRPEDLSEIDKGDQHLQHHIFPTYTRMRQFLMM